MLGNVQRSTIALFGVCYYLGDARVARRTLTLPLQTFKGRGLCMDRVTAYELTPPRTFIEKNPKVL